MLAAPVLFVIGVVFTYFVVLPPAVQFLQGYNADQFNALVQAKPLYSFEVLTMAADRPGVPDAAGAARLARSRASSTAAP